jgi:hypothetical protein
MHPAYRDPQPSWQDDGVTGDEIGRVDAAIGACLLAAGSSRSLKDLAALGPTALVRLVEAFTGRGPAFARPTGIRLAGREEVDVWSAMLGQLARAYPDAFLDAVEDGRLSHPDTLTVVCLGWIDDPRATALLARASTAGDWLVRYHAVRGLAGRADDTAQAALAHALDDPEEMIRSEAARARRRRRRRP